MLGLMEAVFLEQWLTNDQIITFQMNSAGVGKLSIISRTYVTLWMIVNVILNDVVGSDCSLRFGR